MFPGIYSTHLHSESSDNEGRCCWKVMMCLSGGGGTNKMQSRGWITPRGGGSYQSYMVLTGGLTEKMAFMQGL